VGDGAPSAMGPATWRSLFAVKEFRSLWVAQAVSLTGDQLARVAVAVLVFDRTDSALLTAAVYAITYLPWLIGGPLLGGLADRYPRRTVMVVCNLCSAALVALMAVPSVPLPVLCVLLFIIVLLESPFTAARAALMVDVLPDDRYVLATAINNLTIQGAQVFGFAAGGVLVAAIGSRQALLVDAGTFLFSAILLRLTVRSRPAADARPDGEGIRGWGSRIAAGSRLALLVPLCVLSCAPLILCALQPSLEVTLVLLALSGLGASYQLVANAAFMQTVPQMWRGQAFGLASAGLVAGQGISLVLAGAIAEFISPPLVVAGAGVLGTVVALGFAGIGRRLASPAPATAY
jgi:MFS family permease